MIKSNIFLDDGTKRVTKRNRNYFFAATLGIVFVNFYLYFFPVIGPSLADARPDWDTFSVVNLFEAFLAAYTHAGFQHCSLNMLCFLIAGAYLERKQGTFRFLSFVAVLSFFSGFATATNYLSLKFVGFSGVNYALYAYIFIDYIFVLARRQKRDLVNAIAGGRSARAHLLRHVFQRRHGKDILRTLPLRPAAQPRSRKRLFRRHSLRAV